MCAAVEETAMNTNELVVEIRPGKKSKKSRACLVGAHFLYSCDPVFFYLGVILCREIRWESLLGFKGSYHPSATEIRIRSEVKIV